MSAKVKTHPGAEPRYEVRSLLESEPLVVDYLSTAIVVLDRDLCLRFLNPAAEELLDVSDKQVRGMSVTQLLPEADIFETALTRVIESGRPLTERDMQLTLPVSEHSDYAMD